MTSKERKVVFALIAIMIVIFLIVVIVKTTGKKTTEGEGNSNILENEEKYVTELSNGTKLNNSEDLNNSHKYKNVEISDIQFTSQNGNSVLLADVTNTGSTAFEEEKATIVLLGENNEVLREIALIIPRLEAGETQQINSIITADVVNVKDFRVEAAK